MIWPLFFSTFVLIFLAELGDKTQLAVMSQSATAASRWTVFAAGSLALVTSTAIGVLAGELIRRYIPDERYVKCAGGVLFLIFGCLMLREVFLPRPEKVVVGRELTRITGWVGRFVIQQAAVFEKAAYEDYEALAARSLDPAEKAVFERLAIEERWHHEAMMVAVASGGDRDMEVTSEMAGELPAMDELMQDASAKASKEVEHAIEHERAMAQFYRTLSKQSVLPRLRETFAALAVAEENHAHRLMALRRTETGNPKPSAGHE